MTHDPEEVLACTRDVAGPLVDIRKRVPEPQVPLGRMSDGGSGSEHLDRPGQVSSIGLGACEDKPSLHQDVRRWRRAAELVVDGLHPAMVAHGPMAVCDNRVLVERPGEAVELFKLAGCLPPPPEPVEGQAVQLANGRRRRSDVDNRTHLPQGLLVAIVRVGVRRQLHTGRKPRAVDARNIDKLARDSRCKVAGTLEVASFTPAGLCDAPLLQRVWPDWRSDDL